MWETSLTLYMGRFFLNIIIYIIEDFSAEMVILFLRFCTFLNNRVKSQNNTMQFKNKTVCRHKVKK